MPLIPGFSFDFPEASLPPSLLASGSGNEIPTEKQQHAIDEVFDFYKDDAAAMPSGTTTWTILRPRRNGFITSVAAWLSVDGASGTANTFDVLKNGSTILTGAISLSHLSGDNTLVAGTLTPTTGVAFSADDRIAVQGVKGSNDGTGPHVRIKGYYVGA